LISEKEKINKIKACGGRNEKEFISRRIIFSWL
jgi:hypothetical protein